jgi:very-short-patch-repair endonuclease
MSQYQIQLMTVDLCFLDIRLIIEVDSSLHNRPEIQDKDNVRNWKLKQLGYTVLRFSNNAVNSSLAGVVLNVQRYVTSLS